MYIYIYIYIYIFIYTHFPILQGVFEVLKLQYFKFLYVLPLPKVYSEPNQTF